MSFKVSLLLLALIVLLVPYIAFGKDAPKSQPNPYFECRSKGGSVSSCQRYLDEAGQKRLEQMQKALRKR